MNYATIKNCDIANGPGVRVSLFVSGCTHRCPGCFNEIAWDFNYGEPFTQETIDRIINMLRPSYIRGLTLLGGEPFDPRNQGAVVELLRQVKKELPEKTIWAFSGYLFDRDILSGRLGDWEITKEYVSYLDVLVDGPFVQEKKNPVLWCCGRIEKCNKEINDMDSVRVKILRPGAKLPSYGSEEAAGADLYACLEAPVVLQSGCSAFIPTGIALEVPKNCAGLIYARSGMACKRGLAPANKVGVVDSDYRGEITVVLHNHGTEAQTVDNGERIAQFVITPVLQPVYEAVEQLSDTVRSGGGFGSTGV